MTTTWTQIIEQQPVALENVRITSQVTPLSKFGVLHVSGDDAKGFLQNLVTNNVNDLALNQGQLAGLCNPKGRLLAIFSIFHRDNGFYLVLPKEMCAGLMQRLSMYILRSKVTITDLSSEYACLGMQTKDSIDLHITLPTSNYAITDLNEGFVIKLPAAEGQRFLFIGPNANAASLVNDLLNTDWQLSAEASWELTEIESGLPMIYPTTKEAFTTQQVNLDLVDGVSFKKGCYPGQEIVARLHYLGSPSRRMFIAKLDSQDAIQAGQEVLTEDGSVAGHVVRWVYNHVNSLTMLLSLKLTDYQSALFLNNRPISLVKSEVPE